MEQAEQIKIEICSIEWAHVVMEAEKSHETQESQWSKFRLS